MDNGKGILQTIWDFLAVSNNANAIQTIIAVLGLLGAIGTWVWFKKNNGHSGPPTVKLTLQQHKDLIAQEIAEAEKRLKTAHDEEKALLWKKIEELHKRAANPEQALQEARKTIAELEDALTREGNGIGGDRMEEARQALEAGDFSIADTLFAEIEDQEMLAVERTARAAFARGNIAEQDIRWADSEQHYTRAAQLHPNYEHLFFAREFAWRNGDYDKAILLGKDLIKIAKTEYGETHEKYAAALNAHAISLDSTGKYKQAEPLYLQALETSKQTIGEAHPDYAIQLNNLAALYRATGKYDLAEPLYLKALKIGKQSIGDAHPNYAKYLNNLALLYETTGRYGRAEPLYLQALEIDKQTIGETHPDYAAHLNNLALLYEATEQYELAEPLYKQALEIVNQPMGRAHPNYAKSINNLAALYETTRKYKQAEPLYLQALEIGKQTIGEAHPNYATNLNNLAGLYNVTGKYEQAEPLYKQAIQILETTLGSDHQTTQTVKANYETLLKKWKK